MNSILKKVRANDLFSGLLISAAMSLCLCVFFAIISEKIRDPILLPIFICGTLMGVDVVNWLRGKLDIFDPVGIIGILGFHFTCTAPAMHIIWDIWYDNRLAQLPEDWMEWSRPTCWIYAVGTLLYRIALLGMDPRPKGFEPNKKVWLPDYSRVFIIISITLMVSFVGQLFVYKSFGGLGGYIRAYETRMQYGGMSGLGVVFMITETFPIVSLIAFTLYAKKRRMSMNLITVAVILLSFFFIQFMFGGMRGSRSNTIWALFWAVGIIHFWLYPFKRIIIGCGILFIFSFMYIYGFYKQGGVQGLMNVLQARNFSEIESGEGRTTRTLLLGDLARFDTHVAIVYRLRSPGSDYEIGYGRSYLGSAAMLIPRVFWPDRPPTKLKEGTELFFGKGTLEAGIRTSKIFSLAGEAMLNFGIAGGIISFGFYGLFIRYFRRFVIHLHPLDFRIVFVPFLINFSFNVFSVDSDNLMYFFFKNGAVVMAIVFFSKKTMRLGQISSPMLPMGKLPPRATGALPVSGNPASGLRPMGLPSRAQRGRIPPPG